MAEPINLGYWGIRGRGQVPRLLLAYTGLQWIEKKYLAQDEFKGIGKDQTSLGLPFPNLPYLIHGDFKLTQSRAIMNYIIAVSGKSQLLGKNIKDEAMVQNIVSVFNEILIKCTQLAFNFQNFEEKQSESQQFVQSKLNNLSHIIVNKDFVLGYLTLADFLISQISNYIEKFFPSLYSQYGFLKKSRQNFESLEKIQAYYAGQNSVKGPFIPPIGRIKF